MKLTYKTHNGRFTFEQDGVDRKTAFELVAVLDELFGEEKCGLCGTSDVRHVVTHPQGFTYYKLKCMNPECGAVLDFGQNQDQKGLFVKKWDSDAKQPLPDGGWYKWEDRQDRQDGGGGHGRPQQTNTPQRVNQPSQGRPQQPAKQGDGDDGSIPF